MEAPIRLQKLHEFDQQINGRHATIITYAERQRGGLPRYTAAVFYRGKHVISLSGATAEDKTATEAILLAETAFHCSGY